MRRLLAPLLVCVLFFSACSLLPFGAKKTERPTPENKLEQILDVLESKDAAAASALFCEQALLDAGDMQPGIDYLFSLGDVLETGKITQGSSDSTSSGWQIRKIYSWCDLTTTEGEYALFMLIYDRYGGQSEHIGLYSLRIVAYDENYTKHYTYWQDMQQPGIYVPSEHETAEG